MINTNISITGQFFYYSHPFTTDELKGLVAEHGLAYLDSLALIKQAPNLVMNTAKLKAIDVFSSADKLVITSQTSTPASSETTYPSPIYTSTIGDEFYRSLSNVNPFEIAWNITSSSANGTWGSLIVLDTLGAMINRSLAGGITKGSNDGIIVKFLGTVS